MASGFVARNFERRVVSGRLGMEKTGIIRCGFQTFGGAVLHFVRFDESPRQARPKMNCQFSEVFGCTVGSSNY